MKDKKLIAMDSSTLLSIIGKDGENTPQADKDNTIRLLDENLPGYELIFPALVVTECLCVVNRHLQGEKLQQAESLLKLFFGNKKIADIDRKTAYLGAELGRQHHLKGADAAILATAVRYKADYLITMDKELLKFDGSLPVKVIRPSNFPLTQTLPGLAKIN